MSDITFGPRRWVMSKMGLWIEPIRRRSRTKKNIYGPLLRAGRPTVVDLYRYLWFSSNRQWMKTPSHRKSMRREFEFIGGGVGVPSSKFPDG